MPDERPWHRVVWRAGKGEAKARRDAFAELHREHASGVFNLALRLLGNREDAQDVSQEVLLKAYEKLADPGDLNQRAWLYRVTVNACYDHLRARKRKPAVPWDPELELDLPPTIDRCELAELRAQITEAFRCVPPAQRAALLLREIHGLHNDEVAYALGVKASSAEVTLVRARTSFRRHFLEISGRGGVVESGTSGERRTLTAHPHLGGLAAAVGLPIFALKAAPLPASLGLSAVLASASASAGVGGGAMAGVLAKVAAGLSTKAAVVAIGATVVAGSAGVYGVERAEHAGHRVTVRPATPSPAVPHVAATARPGRAVAARVSPTGAAAPAASASSPVPSPSVTPLVVGESGGSASGSPSPAPSPTDTAGVMPSPSPSSTESASPSSSPCPSPTPSVSPAPSASPSAVALRITLAESERLVVPSALTGTTAGVSKSSCGRCRGGRDSRSP